VQIPKQNGVWPFLLSCCHHPTANTREGLLHPVVCMPTCFCSHHCLHMEVPHGHTLSCPYREAGKCWLCSLGEEINLRQKLALREPTAICLGHLSERPPADGLALPRTCLCFPCRHERFPLMCNLRSGQGSGPGASKSHLAPERSGSSPSGNGK